MKISEINIRDPFILTFNGAYYMYGSWVPGPDQIHGQTKFEVYKSYDLIDWEEPKIVLDNKIYYKDKKDFWAPEVHFYKDMFYMFASFKGVEKGFRGTHVLVSDTPDGYFKPHSNSALTPDGWECLDGTLYIEEGTPYMVFCHEWTQVGNGEICVIELSDDLRTAIGEPQLLFRASEADWTKNFDGKYVTDGPFLFKEDGTLYMLWSSYGLDGYVESFAYSESGSLFGKWIQSNELLYNKDGGHGMLFEDLSGCRRLVLHTPNHGAPAAPALFYFSKNDKDKFECKVDEYNYNLSEF